MEEDPPSQAQCPGLDALPLRSEAAILTTVPLPSSRGGWGGHTCWPPHLSRQGQVPRCGAKDGRGVRAGAQALGPTLSRKVGGLQGPHPILGISTTLL